MSQALKEATLGFRRDEVPIGAVITWKNKIIAKAFNQVETLKDATAHAEILAITQAEECLKNKWLNGCTLYVTIEPCVMCATACVLARIETIIFGAREPKYGGIYSRTQINSLGLNHTLRIQEGILQQEAKSLMQEFFQKKRRTKSCTERS